MAAAAALPRRVRRRLTAAPAVVPVPVPLAFVHYWQQRAILRADNPLNGQRHSGLLFAIPPFFVIYDSFFAQKARAGTGDVLKVPVYFTIPGMDAEDEEHFVMNATMTMPGYDSIINFHGQVARVVQAAIVAVRTAATEYIKNVWRRRDAAHAALLEATALPNELVIQDLLPFIDYRISRKQHQRRRSKRMHH